MGNDQPKTKRETLKYVRILLRETVSIPGRKDRNEDVLRNVEGRPNAGGIDVYGMDKDGQVTVSTIPWLLIKQADRLGE